MPSSRMAMSSLGMEVYGRLGVACIPLQSGLHVCNIILVQLISEVKEQHVVLSDA